MKVRLKKILGIKYTRCCFCGRPLLGNLCEVHGADVRIAMRIIHAQFEALNKTNQHTRLLNVKLTENQFLSLFVKRLVQPISAFTTTFSGEVTAFGGQHSLTAVLTEFYEVIEFEECFNRKRLKEVQITESGITVNFFWDISHSRDQKLKFSFEALVTRKLSDYINWRMHRCKASRESVVQSLLTTRSSILTIGGAHGTIVAIAWPTEKSSPKVIIINQETNKQATYQASELFQTTANFFLNPARTTRVITALDNFARKFLGSFRNFLQQQSFELEFKKEGNRRNEKFFEQLEGKGILLSWEQLEQLEKTHEFG